MSKTTKLFFFCLTFFLLATKIGLAPIFASGYNCSDGCPAGTSIYSESDLGNDSCTGASSGNTVKVCWYKDDSGKGYSCCAQGTTSQCQFANQTCSNNGLSGICKEYNDQVYCDLVTGNSSEDYTVETMKSECLKKNARFLTFNTWFNRFQSPCLDSETLIMHFSYETGGIPLQAYCCALVESEETNEEANFIKACQGHSLVIKDEPSGCPVVENKENAEISIGVSQPWLNKNTNKYYYCCSWNSADAFDPSVFNDSPSNSLTLDLDVVDLKYSDLESMNPLKFSSVFSDPSSRTPGAIINRALTVIIFPIAGIGLLILILWGGFQMISGSTTGKQNSIDMGKKRITTAIIGFIVLFCVYWIWRLITLATGLKS